MGLGRVGENIRVIVVPKSIKADTGVPFSQTWVQGQSELVEDVCTVQQVIHSFHGRLADCWSNSVSMRSSSAKAAWGGGVQLG